MACWLARAAGPSRSTLRRGSSGGGLRHQSVRALHGGVDCSGGGKSTATTAGGGGGGAGAAAAMETMGAGGVGPT